MKRLVAHRVVNSTALAMLLGACAVGPTAADIVNPLQIIPAPATPQLTVPKAVAPQFLLTYQLKMPPAPVMDPGIETKTLDKNIDLGIEAKCYSLKIDPGIVGNSGGPLFGARPTHP